MATWAALSGSSSTMIRKSVAEILDHHLTYRRSVQSIEDSKARDGARNPRPLSPTATGDEVVNRRNELLDVRHLDAVRRVWKHDQLGAPDMTVHLPGD